MIYAELGMILDRTARLPLADSLEQIVLFLQQEETAKLIQKTSLPNFSKIFQVPGTTQEIHHQLAIKIFSSRTIASLMK